MNKVKYPPQVRQRNSTVPKLSKKIQEYLDRTKVDLNNLQMVLEQDKFWLRSQRIEHAKFRFEVAKTDEEKAFWTKIIVHWTDFIRKTQEEAPAYLR